MKKKILLRDFPGLKICFSDKAMEKVFKTTEDFLLLYHNIGNANKYSKYLLQSKNEIKKMISSVNIENIEYHSESYEKAVLDSEECLLSTIKNLGKGDLLVGLCNVLKINNNETKTGIIISKMKVNVEVEVLKIPDYFFYNISRKGDNIQLTYCRADGIINIPEIKGTTVIQSFRKVVSGSIWMGNQFFHDKGMGLESTTGEGGRDIAWIIKYLAFKELAKTEVETFSLVDDSKIKFGLSRFQKEAAIEKLEGIVDVKYYSANWYREIICDHEFKVSGHWRNQPYKDGYKLIFIKPFTKHGYHRKAEKDNVQLEEA